MIAIVKKEIQSFFGSPVGYLVIGLFLVVNGLFLWVFPGNYNIFDSGFADLAPYFELAPWILLFLIPALTMRSFSDEKKLGTMELLLTKPLSIRSIVVGKYLGTILLICIALLPTLFYIFTISDLGNPQGNWDVGSTIGSFIGLLFLAASYTAIGIFCSSLTSNQVVAFLSGVFLCFALYYGFEGLAEMSNSLFLEKLGMKSHFNSVARGVLDTRDLVYFFSITALFLGLTVFNFRKN
ncbi:gliding motility-associated ABC transporter permease subunit GldF [Aureitalea sp. L0-47]|uniref:gliding motility-associated ABC transporter permease subunit GldF n=1 Tax=Aureitalea sp. L0-47 TaxID=2816962 RepID=UPI00223757B3|nr:gliding motility-associated ABC transporter permease subunit GldF [Aureitalea sp. L0-47]MCW5520373.1 gliding motility-associated ABC transporter permease subunit GldF [Aureitalea sp. L0-47]